MSPVRKELAVTAQPHASCQQCDWQYYESRVAREEAKAHARNNIGHSVVIVVEKRELWVNWG